MLACLRAAEIVDGMPYASTLDEVARDLEDLGEHLPTDAIVARTHRGDVAAFGTVYVRPGSNRDRRATLWGETHPDHRAAEEALLDWMAGRGQARLAGMPDDLPRFLEMGVAEHLARRRALLEERGFGAARWWSEMGRDLSVPLPDAAAPDGVAVAPWDPSRSEEVRAAHNAAFRDHWGSNPLEAEQWDRWFVGSEAFRPDLSFVALADGAVVGHATSYAYPNDVPVKGRSEGWIGQMGVLPGWRRRGVASALVVACLRAYAGSGLDYGMLVVDADNPSGAVGLYDRLGFVTEHRTVTYRRPVDAS